MSEALIFRSEDGREAPGHGELIRHGQTKRALFAGAFAAVGLGFGLATFVPGPHMCVTWIFPFIGAFFGLRAWWNEAELSAVEGACPACGAEGIKVQGGQLGTRPLARVCPECMAKLAVVCSVAPTPNAETAHAKPDADD